MRRLGSWGRRVKGGSWRDVQHEQGVSGSPHVGGVAAGGHVIAQPRRHVKGRHGGRCRGWCTGMGSRGRRGRRRGVCCWGCRCCSHVRCCFWGKRAGLTRGHGDPGVEGLLPGHGVGGWGGRRACAHASASSAVDSCGCNRGGSGCCSCSWSTGRRHTAERGCSSHAGMCLRQGVVVVVVVMLVMLRCMAALRLCNHRQGSRSRASRRIICQA